MDDVRFASPVLEVAGELANQQFNHLRVGSHLHRLEHAPEDLLLLGRLHHLMRHARLPLERTQRVECVVLPNVYPPKVLQEPNQRQLQLGVRLASPVRVHNPEIDARRQLQNLPVQPSVHRLFAVPGGLAPLEGANHGRIDVHEPGELVLEQRDLVRHLLRHGAILLRGVQCVDAGPVAVKDRLKRVQEEGAQVTVLKTHENGQALHLLPDQDGVLEGVVERRVGSERLPG
mmetsp:Transcript_13552/g.50441  ORF Transcript_13552/g.50441 Transcript_13552/m.50441 type:complete len:231 (-) Transcript_13552:1491-2183(-)